MALDHGAQPRRCTVVADHPDGTCEQALDRGLLPRLSIGTLQLSIRCSSIHFLPMRSFPVSDGPLAGIGGPGVWCGLVRLPVLRKGRRCQAHRENKTDQPSVHRFHRLSSQKLGRQIKHAEIHVATRNLQTTARLPLITSCAFTRTRATDDKDCRGVKLRRCRIVGASARALRFPTEVSVFDKRLRQANRICEP